MKNVVERGRLITSEADARKCIPNSTEQNFAIFLITKSPHLEIIYEPDLFANIESDGVKRGTVPDFRIRNPRNPNARNAYIEITIYPKNGKNGEDPKKKQRGIMGRVAGGERYIVFYQEDLVRMQRHNPQVEIVSKELLQKVQSYNGHTKNT